MNQELLASLKGLRAGGEGNLLETDVPGSAEAQCRFILHVMARVRPKWVVEIGTNKGLWCLFVLSNCPDVTVETVDPDPMSARAVEILSGAFPGRILGRAMKSEAYWRDNPAPADLVYVDGDHSEISAFKDLENASEITGNILVDDVRNLEGPAKGLMAFMARGGWKVAGQTDPTEDPKGMVWITKL